MAGEITWRQMQAPTGAEALRAMAYASAGIQNAFSGGADLAAKYGKLQDEAAQQQYLSLLDSAKTPEALEALRQSGQLEQFQQGLTPQALAAVRPAADARTKALTQQLLDANTAEQSIQKHGDWKVDTANRDIDDMVKSHIAKREYAAARTLIAENPQLRNKAAYEIAIKEAERQKLSDDRSALEHTARLTGLNNSNTLTSQQITQGDINVAEAKRNVEEAAKVREAEEQLRLAGQAHQEQVNAAVKKQTELANYLNIPVGSNGLPDFSKIEDEPSRETLRKYFYTELEKKGSPGLEGMDTAAMKAFIDTLKGTGKYSPAQIQALQNQAITTFNTLGPGQVGRDAAQVTLGDNAAQAAYDHFSQNYSMPATDAEKDGMLEEVNKIVNSNLPRGYNEIRRNSLLGQIAKFLGPEGGIEVVDPKNKKNKIRIYPSLSNLKAMVQENVGWGAFDWGGNDLENAFEAWGKAQDTNTLAGVIKEFQGYNLRKALRTTEEKKEEPKKK